MKKIVSFVYILVVCSLNLGAQDFDFSTDSDGDAYVSGSLDYSCSYDAAWRRVKDYVERIYTAEYNKINIDESRHTITVKNGLENSKVRVNPFAGGFWDNIGYTLVIKQGGSSKSSFTYSFKDLVLQSRAAGLVNYDRQQPLRKLIQEYNRLKPVVEDTSIPKKQKKDEINDFKDVNSSLTNAYGVLMKRVEDIRLNLE